MLYVGLIVFGCLVAWSVREETHATREREYMNNYHRAEYQLPFLTTN